MRPAGPELRMNHHACTGSKQTKGGSAVDEFASPFRICPEIAGWRNRFGVQPNNHKRRKLRQILKGDANSSTADPPLVCFEPVQA